MNDAQRVKLLDAAMRSRDAGGYLAGMQGLFEDGKRTDDALTAAALRALIQAGEIETVMQMRAKWSGRRPAPHPRPGRSR